MGTKEIGSYLKLHSSDAAGAKVSDHLMISSHGLKISSGAAAEFVVPDNVEIIFYGPDHYFLEDPGLVSMMWGMLAVYEKKTAGQSCANYALSKFQGYHGASDVLSIIGNLTQFSTLTNKLKQLSPNYIEPSDWETYVGINSIYSHDAPQVVTDLQQCLQQEKSQIDDLRKRVDGLAKADSPLTPKDEQMSSLWRNQMQQRQGFVDSVRGRLTELERNLERRPMDVCTIRHRMTPTTVFHTVTLQELVNTLQTNGYRYNQIHCSFCRGSITDFFDQALLGREHTYAATEK